MMPEAVVAEQHFGALGLPLPRLPLNGRRPRAGAGELGRKGGSREFVTILRRQRDDAADNADLARTQLYDDLVRVIDNEQPAD
jgi:hypothetical protein